MINVYEIIRTVKRSLYEMQSLEDAMSKNFYRALDDPNGDAAADFLTYYNIWNAKYSRQARRLNPQPEDLMTINKVEEIESMLTRFYRMAGAARWEAITA